METTKMKVETLLDILQENRTKHEKEYKSAKKEWQKRCTKALRKALKKAESGDRVIELKLFSELPRPQHYLREYDRVIRRLDLEVEDIVELDEREFEAWVMDEWVWHGAFAGATQMYNG